MACSTPADLFVDVPKPPEKPTRQKRSKPRSAIPPDWTPDATGVIYATERGVDVLGETPRFVDYHLAKGSLMADWPAAWRTWVGNAVRFGKPKPRVAPPDITASFARFMRPASDEPPDYCTIDVPATAYSDVE